MTTKFVPLETLQFRKQGRVSHIQQIELAERLAAIDGVLRLPKFWKRRRGLEAFTVAL
jgi:hypothetical protein